MRVFSRLDRVVDLHLTFQVHPATLPKIRALGKDEIDIPRQAGKKLLLNSHA